MRNKVIVSKIDYMYDKECIAPFVLNDIYAEKLHKISKRFGISKRRTMQGILCNIYGLESITGKFRFRVTNETSCYVWLPFSVSQFSELKVKQDEEGCSSVAELCRKAIDRTLEEIENDRFYVKYLSQKYFSSELI